MCYDGEHTSLTLLIILSFKFHFIHPTDAAPSLKSSRFILPITYSDPVSLGCRPVRCSAVLLQKQFFIAMIVNFGTVFLTDTQLSLWLKRYLTKVWPRVLLTDRQGAEKLM